MWKLADTFFVIRIFKRMPIINPKVMLDRLGELRTYLLSFFRNKYACVGSLALGGRAKMAGKLFSSSAERNFGKISFFI